MCYLTYTNPLCQDKVAAILTPTTEYTSIRVRIRARRHLFNPESTYVCRVVFIIEFDDKIHKCPPYKIGVG